LGFSFVAVGAFVGLIALDFAAKREREQKRRQIFEASGWHYTARPEKHVVYRIEGKLSGESWSFELRRESETQREVKWQMPLVFGMETVIETRGLHHNFIESPLIFGIASWFLRREINKNKDLTGEEQMFLRQIAPIGQALMRARRLSHPQLGDLCFTNSMLRLEIAHQIFDEQFEAALVEVLRDIPASQRKTFKCRLESAQLVLSLKSELKPERAVQLIELGLLVAGRAQLVQVSGEEVLNVAPLRRAFETLPSHLHRSMLEELPPELRQVWNEAGD
jgi:hypothetical protein